VRAPQPYDEVLVTMAGMSIPVAAIREQIAWAGDRIVEPTRVTLVEGRPGTRPVVIGTAPLRDADDAVVQVGVSDPVEVLELQPACGCDACDTGSSDLLGTLDDAFVLALSGGVYAVRDGERVVRRSLDGWSASDVRDGERWLDDAAAGRRTDGVVRGEPWR